MYDTGALIAADNNDRRMWSIHNRALWRGVRPIVPAACVVEAWRDHKQVNLTRLLAGCEVESLTRDFAIQSGAMRKLVPSTVGPVDATVAEAAVRRNGAVVTSDSNDIEQLSSAARCRIQIIDI